MPRYYKLKLYPEDQRQLIGKVTLEKMREKQLKKSVKRKKEWHNLTEAIFASFERLLKHDDKKTLV